MSKEVLASNEAWVHCSTSITINIYHTILFPTVCGKRNSTFYTAREVLLIHGIIAQMKTCERGITVCLGRIYVHINSHYRLLLKLKKS